MSIPKLGILGAYAIRDGFLEKEMLGPTGLDGDGLGAVRTDERKKPSCSPKSMCSPLELTESR